MHFSTENESADRWKRLSGFFRRIAFLLSRHCLPLLAALFPALAAGATTGAPAPATKPPAPASILVIGSDELPSVQNSTGAMYSGARIALLKQLGSGTQLSVEFLDPRKLRNPEYERIFTTFLREKYARQQFQGVVVIGEPALRFAVAQRNELFPGVPIAHMAVSNSVAKEFDHTPGVGGLPMKLDPAPILDTIRTLHPGLKRLVMITGSSPEDKARESDLREACRKLDWKIVFEFWTDISFKDLETRLAALGPGDLVLTPGVEWDSTGADVLPMDFWRKIRNTGCPTYGYHSGYTPWGLTCSQLPDPNILAGLSIEVLVRMISGEKAPPDAPKEAPVRYIFSWPEMQRWKIPKDRLPPNSVISQQKPTFYELYRTRIWIVSGVIVVQSALLVALLAQRRRRKKVEDSLRESSARIKQAIGAGEIGLWIWNPETDSVWHSPEAAGLLGLPPDGRPDLATFLSSMDPGERERVGDLISRAGRSGALFETDFGLASPGNRERWLSIKGSVDRSVSPDEKLVRGVLIDITARVEAERSLRERDERFRLAVNAAPGAMLMIDSSGRVLLANDRAATLFGYPADELLGMQADRLAPRLFHLRQPGGRLDYADVARFRSANEDLSCLKRDGTPVPIELEISPMEVDGEPCILASIMDVTERKRTEEKIQQQRQQLNHLTRISILGEISGSLGHELNQPLAAILCNAQTAARRLESGGSPCPEAAENLRDIIESGKRASEIISRLRAMLRRDEHPHVPLDANTVVTDVMRIMQGELKVRRIPASVRLAKEELRMQGDPIQLQQVLINLILNACDAMGHLPAEGRGLVVRTSGEAGDTLRIAVEDLGHGVPQDMNRKIFEPFYSTKTHGLGLGLSICSSIVTAHGGTMKLSGNEGPGTIASIRLPRS